MPIYEYQCDACGHRLEHLQKISEEPLKECPECGKPALRKLVSAAAFQLKGTGWYVTDFRDKGAKKKSGDGDKPASTEDKTGKADAKPADSGKSDTKPAAESPAKPAKAAGDD